MDRQPAALKTVDGSEFCASQLTNLQERLSSFLRPYPCRVYLFGSWATRQARQSSDVDIAILPETSLPTGLLSQLRFELEESSLLLSVDVIDLSQTPPTFQQRVISEGKLWIDSTNE